MLSRRPSPKAGIEGAQNIRRRVRSRGNAPISRRHVVHGIGKSRRRDFARRQRQRLADFVADLAVAPGGGKYAGYLRGIDTGARGGFQRDPQATLTTRPVRRRSAGGSIAGLGSTVAAGSIRLAAGEHGHSLRPIVESGPQNSDAADECGHLHPAMPKIKLQFVPPNPNELLSTRLIRARRFSLM